MFNKIKEVQITKFAIGERIYENKRDAIIAIISEELDDILQDEHAYDVTSELIRNSKRVIELLQMIPEKD